jgi:hypothetical protein
VFTILNQFTRFKLLITKLIVAIRSIFKSNSLNSDQVSQRLKSYQLVQVLVSIYYLLEPITTIELKLVNWFIEIIILIIKLGF